MVQNLSHDVDHSEFVFVPCLPFCIMQALRMSIGLNVLSCMEVECVLIR
jgi:hypothetical protein